MNASFAGLGAVMMASLVGSLHCVAMCGPLAALHHGGGGGRAGRDGKASAWRGLLIHQLGRGLGYLVLGVLAGIAGKLVDLAGAALAIQRAAMITAAAALVVWGLLLASHAAGHPLARMLGKARAGGEAAATSPTSSAPSWFGRGLVQLGKRPPARRAFGLGLLNALLPCGWLWAFVALAASTGHPLAGAATMFVFWLGTLPALLGVNALAAPLLRRLRPRWPLVTAALVLGLAGTALLLRLPLVTPHASRAPASHAAHSAHSSANEPAPHCHDPSAVPALPSAASSASASASSSPDDEVSP